ncbi:MAG: family 78 glycoside hydrolase catalytic domain [Eubacteriales bacterium]
MKKVQWIKSPVNTEGAAYTFSKSFSTDNEVKSATAKISSVGVYKAELDGEKLGDGVLAPGFTSYYNRTQYKTYDITDKISHQNKIEITVAPGWAVGHIGYDGGKARFADHVSSVCEIEIVFSNGKTEYITTDETWDVYTSKTRYADIYMGETFDATYIPELIGKALNDDACLDGFPLVPQAGDDIIENERIAPVSFIVTPKGERVIDFGQNMTGYVEFSIKGKKGDRIVTDCAEVLDKDGNFYNGNYRKAKNLITFVLDGVREKYKPEYSFQGFRYIRLNEYPEETPSLDNIRGIVVHTDMKRTGYFDCANEEINQLYHNIIWGQKGNYLDIPTDCPQRDERLGWTGDAQVFCRTAATNFNVKRFFEKWLADMRAEQGPDGMVGGVVPTCFYNAKRTPRLSAAWGDAAVIIPWQLYLAYGDKKILEDNFELMRRWTEYIHSAGPEEYLWLGGFHYGDWLAMDGDTNTCLGATSNDLIASAFFANAVDILIRAGEVIGKNVDEYRALYKKVVAKFREYFMENGMPKDTLPLTEKPVPEGHAGSDVLRKGMTQTSIVLILKFGLCLPEEKKALADKLEELIRDFGCRMSTGFVGTPYLLHVLSENGKTDLAYDLLFQNQNPSWLYSVEHGATTMWEHWNGIKEDGSFWSESMNSYNHYAYGSVGDWLYGVVAGINTDVSGAGYKKIILSPKPDRRLGFVNSSVETVNGKVESRWYYKGDTVYFEFSVPKGCEATIILPNGYTEKVSAGKYMYTV